MLTRPTLNIALLAAIIGSAFFIDSSSFVGYLLLGVLLALGLLLVFSRHFLMGRSLGAKRRWREALAYYEKFEATAKRMQFGAISLPFFMSIYTYNGVALAKNNMAFCYLNDGQRGLARQLCLGALDIDPKYAVPHINLAIIAALEGDEASASEWLRRGISLGYRNRGVQRYVRNTLARVNVEAGNLIADHKDGSSAS